jgi:hypothetical protein
VSRVVSTVRTAAVASAVVACAGASMVFVPTAAAETVPVDAETGPVAFANVASLSVADDGYGRPGGSVISETQRSPLTPGTSRLGESRTALPNSDGERAAMGPNYRLDIEHHDVSAGLAPSGVPEATALADFSLTDLANDVTVLRLHRAGTAAVCTSAASPETDASAVRLSLVDDHGELQPVPLPKDGGEVTREGLPFGPPAEIGEDEEATSDVRVRPVRDFDELLRQDQWRDGDVTAVSGWLVEIDTHVRPVGQERLAPPLPGEAEPQESTSPPGGQRQLPRTVRTTFVLGGVSCSVPRDFAPGGGGRAEPAAPPPSVPVTIPAGVGAPGDVVDSAPLDVEPVPLAEPTDSATAWGLGLLAGGAVLGAAAVVLARQSRSSRS